MCGGESSDGIAMTSSLAPFQVFRLLPAPSRIPSFTTSVCRQALIILPYQAGSVSIMAYDLHWFTAAVGLSRSRDSFVRWSPERKPISPYRHARFTFDELFSVVLLHRAATEIEIYVMFFFHWFISPFHAVAAAIPLSERHDHQSRPCD